MSSSIISSHFRNSIRSVYDTFRPFYYIAKPFGHICFNLPNNDPLKHGTSDTSTSATSSSWSSVIALLLNSCFQTIGIISLIPLMNADGHGSKVLMISFQTTMVIRLITQLICNGLAFVRRHRLGEILSRVHRIDEQMLNDVGVQIDYWRQYCYVTGGCFIAIFPMVIFFVGSMKIASAVCQMSLVYTAPMTLVFVYTSLTHAMNIGAYILGLLAVRTRVDTLNTYIAGGAREAGVDDVKFAKNVQRLGCLYEQLNAASDEINDSFCTIVLLETASGFLNHITAGFAMVTIIIRIDDRMKWLMVFTNNCWNGYTQAVIVFMALCGDRLASSGKQTGRLIHQLLNAESRSSASGPGLTTAQWQLAQFSQQVLHQHPYASCGLFSIDWKLIYAVSYCCHKSPSIH